MDLSNGAMQTKRKSSVEFAALVHLKIVIIHPFEDGNYKRLHTR
ncbi:MAG: Fic family protein [Nitrosopumilus sp.]|nr:Fic family protein [Nitrosopumilus sp.]